MQGSPKSYKDVLSYDQDTSVDETQSSYVTNPALRFGPASKRVSFASLELELNHQTDWNRTVRKRGDDRNTRLKQKR
jgi:hypothetical protein